MVENACGHRRPKKYWDHYIISDFQETLDKISLKMSDIHRSEVYK